MGVVYLAERADGYFEQQVAVKLLRREVATDDLVRRFRNERQILASLHHPNIARLYDGGVTEEGRSYWPRCCTTGRITAEPVRSSRKPSLSIGACPTNQPLPTRRAFRPSPASTIPGATMPLPNRSNKKPLACAAACTAHATQTSPSPSGGWGPRYTVRVVSARPKPATARRFRSTKTYGDDHPMTAGAQVDLGVLLRDHGDLEQAAAQTKPALRHNRPHGCFSQRHEDQVMLNVEYRARFTRKTEDCMGEIREVIHLENYRDRTLYEERYLEEDEIRAVEIEAIADTGARTLALPEDVVERLGVKRQREVKVTYADDRQEMRPIVGPITITIAGRSTFVDAIVLPAGSDALIGQIVLERLDLVADCAEERLVPSPDSPHFPGLSLR